jgi:hypothetical protein
LCRIYTNGGGGGTPGGSDGQVQFNDGGTFGGDAGLTYDKTTNVLTAGGISITGMTTGSVLFVGAAGAVSQDNANFFWDDTNNRLGIGTNAPTVTLSIMRDTVATDNSQMFIIQNRSDAGFPYVGFDLQFRTDGGAVNEGGAYISISNFKTGVQDTCAVFQWDWNSVEANKLSITNKKAGPFIFSTTDLERMRIDASGNVRIGASGTISSHLLIANAAAGDIGQIIKLAATPTGDAFRVTSSADAVLMKVDSTGSVFTTGKLTVGGVATINQVTKILQGSDTNDFASVAAGAESAVKTLTITGAVEGDTVFMGMVNTAGAANISWTAWVSAANTVSYKFYNRNTVAAVDLGSIVYKFFVHQQ